MLNQTILVGRIIEDVEIKNNDGRTFANITLAVQRSYKNEDGVYETDFITCTLYNAIATNVAEYCKKGDLVGVKGRLQTENNGLVLIADKVSFLSSKKEEE